MTLVDSDVQWSQSQLLPGVEIAGWLWRGGGEEGRRGYGNENSSRKDTDFMKWHWLSLRTWEARKDTALQWLLAAATCSAV